MGRCILLGAVVGAALVAGADLGRASASHPTGLAPWARCLIALAVGVMLVATITRQARR